MSPVCITQFHSIVATRTADYASTNPKFSEFERKDKIPHTPHCQYCTIYRKYTLTKTKAKTRTGGLTGGIINEQLITFGTTLLYLLISIETPPIQNQLLVHYWGNCPLVTTNPYPRTSAAYKYQNLPQNKLPHLSSNKYIHSNLALDDPNGIPGYYQEVTNSK